MKARIIILCMAILSSITSFAIGEIKWVETSHDFGTFDEEMGNVSCNISFVNVGNEDVVILDVRPTCGCTASDYPRKPIAPGDTASITLTYNPKGRPGKFSKDVIVNTNTDPKKQVIVIKGNVIGSSNSIRSKYPISIGPLKIDTSIIPFGDITKGKTKSAFIGGYNQSNDTLKLKWENTPPYITVSSVPEVIPPGGLVSIYVFFDSSKNNEWGLSKSSFNLVELASKNKQLIELIAIINEDFTNLSDKALNKAPIIKLSQSVIDCEAITQPNEFISKSFTISNMGKSDLIIRRIYTLDRGVIVDIPETIIKKNQQSSFNILIDPRQVDGNILNAKLSILSNDPLKPLTSIRIVGEIKK